MSFLADILASKRDEVRGLDGVSPDLAAAPAPRDFVSALRSPGGGLRVIAEIKRASPSEGPIRPDLDVLETAAAYQAGGAAAISVLTDARWFQGSFELLSAVRAQVDAPVLCKDFLVAPIQVAVARAAGADACLLIVAALTDDELRTLISYVRDLGMEALVEVHDADELARALDAGATVIGVNSRDLRTFEVDLRTAERLMPDIPDRCVRVAESGLGDVADMRRMVRAGADAVLVGSALVRAPDPGDQLRRWRSACAG